MSEREEAVAHVDDLSDGEMKQVTVGDSDVLLVRIDGEYHALHAHCTHYGAPLVDGVLSGDRLVCPWHHACFHVGDGDHMQPPGLDSLDEYGVRVEDDQVIVTLPEKTSGTRQPLLSRRDTADNRTCVVLGAGPAGMHAVEAIRGEGFTGRLVMVTREPYRPYDRPSLSKSYLSGEIEAAADLQWRDQEFYDDHNIELIHEAVETVDAPTRKLTFAGGGTLSCDRLLLATGSTPIPLKVPGASLDGVMMLRTIDDSIALREAARQAEKIVIVGASFIGMEAAFSLQSVSDASVTVVAPEEIPFEGTLGEDVGRLIQSEHESNGVQFELGRTVESMQGDGRVNSVRLDSGDHLSADLVLVGIGVRPNTSLIQGVDRRTDGSLRVDEHLQVLEGVYAAGDIATFPYWRTGEAIRIEHWRLAGQLGKTAGQHMAGQDVSYREIPYFWTAHFDLQVRYVGYAGEWDQVVIDGSTADREFIAYYLRDGDVHAACGVGRDTDMAAVHELMRQERLPDAEALARGEVELQKLVKRAA